MKKIRLMLTGALLLVGALGLVGCSNAANGDDSSTSKETNANSGATTVALTMESIVDEKGFSFTAGPGKATLAITSANAGSDGKYTGNLSFTPPMPQNATAETGTYTATPVKDKAATYDLVVVYSDKTSGAYRVEIKDKDNILVWMSSISYTALASASTATGTPTNADATGMDKAVATTAYKIEGKLDPHTILIKTATASGTKYSGNAEYSNKMVNGGATLSGTYNATPVTSGNTSEYNCEFFFDYNNGITHMGFKLKISDDGKTLTLNMLTFGVEPPTGDGTAATRNKQSKTKKTRLAIGGFLDFYT